MNNNCPLCASTNAPTSWVCFACGAELPAKRLAQGQRRAAASAVAPVMGSPVVKVQNAAPGFYDPPQWLNWKTFGVGSLFFWFVAVPLSCAATNNFGTGTPEPTPTATPEPTATPYPPGYAPPRDFGYSKGIKGTRKHRRR